MVSLPLWIAWMNYGMYMKPMIKFGLALVQVTIVISVENTVKLLCEWFIEENTEEDVSQFSTRAIII